MAHESMVHALEQVHALVKPGGHVIDIHPDGQPVGFHFRSAAEDLLLGYLEESDDYVEYHQADEALESVIAAGLFGVEQSEEFDFHTYADNFDELVGFLAENWSDAVITAEVTARAKELEAEHGVRGTVLVERARIVLLYRKGYLSEL